jgi:hypothetical protein
MFGSLDNFITSNFITSTITHYLSESAPLNYENFSVKLASLIFFGTGKFGRLSLKFYSLPKASHQICYLITPDTSLSSSQLEADVQHIFIENTNFFLIDDVFINH